jgi:predicted dehydrogenase
MSQTSIGIVGSGSIARQVHVPVLLNMPGVRVAWIADANDASAREVAGTFGIPHAPLPKDPADLPPCDIVLLAIPVGVREPYYKAMSARRTAVFAEKPFAVSGADHRRIVEWFPPDRVACGYMRRAYHPIVLLKTVVAERWFGPLRGIRVSEGGRVTGTGVDKSHYDDAGAAGGGALMTLGTHAVDAAIYLTGATECRVRSSDMVMDGRIDRKVHAVVDLVGPDLAGGCQFDFTVSWIDVQENRIELRFENAIVSAPTGADGKVTVRGVNGTRPAADLVGTARAALTAAQAFFLEWEDFIGGVRDGRPSIISAASAIPTTDLVESMYREGNATFGSGGGR